MTHLSSTTNLGNFFMGLKLPSLSAKAKEAIKVGVAFAIVYIIALRYDWLNPYWAGLAVALVATAPSGQSIHKGFSRLLGTIPGVIAALMIFSIAVQDRWVFMSLTALWVTFTTYMMVTDSRNSYFWNVSGFVALIILNTPPDSSVTIFDHSMLRLLETSLGVIVYTSVTMLLWPRTNINTLRQISKSLITSQAQLFNYNVSTLNLPEEVEKRKALRQAEVTFLASLKQTVEAKSADSYEVRESFHVWMEFHALSTELMQTINRFHNGYSGLSNIDLERLFPQLHDYTDEINRRFTLMTKMFDGELEYETNALSLEIDNEYLATLQAFDKIAIASSIKELKTIEQLSIEVLSCAKNILDDSIRIKKPRHKTQKNIYDYIPDREALKVSLFVGLHVVVGYVIWILFDPPSHMTWTTFPAIFAMMIAAKPQLRVNKFMIPFFVNLVLALAIYTLVMPALTTYVGLALLFFSMIFLVMYFFPQPMWMFSFVAIIMIMKVENNQVYDIVGQMNFTLFFVISISVPYALSYILNSPRAEKKVAALLKRYFGAFEYLLLNDYPSKKMGFVKTVQINFHIHGIKVLPAYLSVWSKVINYQYFNNNTPKKVDKLMENLFSLSISIEELIRSVELKQANVISEETKDNIAKWKKGVEAICSNYSDNLDSKVSPGMQKALTKHVDNSQESINQHLDAKLQSMSQEEKENFFQLIGGLQGLSLALLAYAEAAEEIDWRHWEEEVFA